MTPEQIIAALGMRPHPEGGHYVETWRGEPGPDGRACGTAIYYLLRAGEVSHWHRVDAAEIWHWHAGDPLALTLSDAPPDGLAHRLGCALDQGERPQLVVPRGVWQTARPLGAWTLVGCTVSPGFRFEGFEMGAAEWPVP